MTKLFQLAEYICNICLLDNRKPATKKSQEETPTIRFSNENRLIIKRIKYDSNIKCKQSQSKVKMVEGELFK